MNITKIIQSRRAIYPSQFENGDINKDQIYKILENANTAPSHKLTQPWFFKVFKTEHKNKLATEMVNAFEAFFNKKSDLKKKKIHEKCSKSNCIIAIFMKRDIKESIPEWEEIAAVAMSVQNMWLTCSANKIGCYWSSPKIISELNLFLKLKENQKCLGLFYIGKYDDLPKRNLKKIDINQKTEWI